LIIDVASKAASTVKVMSTVVLCPGANVPGTLIFAVLPVKFQALSFKLKPVGI